MEGKYHLQCLNKYYRKAQGASAANDDVQLQDDKHYLAFAELVTYINDKYAKDSSTIFKLSDLIRLRNNRLTQLSDDEQEVYSSRLKNRLF